MPQVLTIEEKQSAAYEIIAILDTMRLQACFVGGEAHYLLGLEKEPDDLDILVFPNQPWHTQEWIERAMFRYTHWLYFVRAKRPDATYRVMWWTNRMAFESGDPGSYDFPLEHSRPFSLKIDILIPPALNLPIINSAMFQRRRPHHMPPGHDPARTLPTAPSKLLLLSKLRWWADVGSDSSKNTVIGLLHLFAQEEFRLSVFPLGPSESYLTDEYMVQALKDIRKHIADPSPDRWNLWRGVGVDIGPLSPWRLPPASDEELRAMVIRRTTDEGTDS